jgi:hypothetical protein
MPRRYLLNGGEHSRKCLNGRGAHRLHVWRPWTFTFCTTESWPGRCRGLLLQAAGIAAGFVAASAVLLGYHFRHPRANYGFTTRFWGHVFGTSLELEDATRLSRRSVGG